MGGRILVSSMDGVEFAGEAAIISGMMFGFYEESGSSESCSTDGVEEYEDDEDEDEDEHRADSDNSAENKAFWEAQHQLLQGILNRTSSLESRIRKATKEAMKAAKLAEAICICQRPMPSGCRNCLMTYVSEQLRSAGFNSAICKSKWRSSKEVPSGEHTYIDVVENLDSKKGETRVVIELNFRAEFEMARASEEYNQLVERLPEVYVGKAERLRGLIKIICYAAKKCMKEKKMHIGPWRKHKYMHAKWFGTFRRTTPIIFLPEGFTGGLQRPKASMLTFDLLENLPNMHSTAVEVL